MIEANSKKTSEVNGDKDKDSKDDQNATDKKEGSNDTTNKKVVIRCNTADERQPSGCYLIADVEIIQRPICRTILG